MSTALLRTSGLRLGLRLAFITAVVVMPVASFPPPSLEGSAAPSAEPALVQTAIVDRIVDGVWAVLLVGPDQREWVIPDTELPTGATQGDWFRVDVKGGQASFTIDRQSTQEARARVAGKLRQLRQRRPTPGFERGPLGGG